MADQAVVDLKHQFDALSVDAQKQVAEYAVQSLPPPSQSEVNNLWLLVVWTFAILLVGGAAAVVLMTLLGKDPKDLLPLVTAALGVLAGLLAPSPVQKN
jgi:hypothetical protein